MNKRDTNIYLGPYDFIDTYSCHDNLNDNYVKPYCKTRWLPQACTGMGQEINQWNNILKVKPCFTKVCYMTKTVFQNNGGKVALEATKYYWDSGLSKQLVPTTHCKYKYISGGLKC